MSKRYVQYTVERSRQFKRFEDKGQQGNPSLCLWCGRRLRRFINEGAVGHESHGHRGDNAFCSLRCGYSYGVIRAKQQFNPIR